MHRGAIAEIDLDAVSNNLNVVKRITGNSPVIAVVKADAYGHGAVEVSKMLVKDGVYCLAVAFTGEAIQLRDAGIQSRILVLFDKHNIAEFFEYNLIPVAHDLQTALKLSEEAKKRNIRLDVHIKIDTGMGRLGFSNNSLISDISAISRMDHINVAGLMSHFSEADIADKSCADEQLKRFNAVRDILCQNLKGGFLCHMANSAATISFSDACLDAVRPGIMLYGCSPIQNKGSRGQGSKGPMKSKSLEPSNPRILEPSAQLIPAMTVKTRILTLRRLPKGSPVSYGGTFITRRDSLIAVIPVGYADGYSRALSNNSDVLIKSVRAPVVGRVCMDLTMIDATGIEGVAEDDDVVLLGRQGKEEITAGELAIKAGTIPYEVLTSMGNRSRRVYA